MREGEKKKYITFKPTDKHVTKVSSGHLKCTHTHRLRLSTQDNDLFSWTVYTLAHSKPKPQA